VAVPELDVAPEVASLSRRLLPEAEAFGQRMAEKICAAIPEYAEGQFVGIDEVISSCTDNMRFVLGMLAGDRVSLDSPRATGTARADQGVPYAAVLQAFRIGGRFIWEELVAHAEAAERDVLLLAAADIWAVSDDLATHATEAYRTALADRARRDGQRRAALVAALLDGDAGEAERIWEASGVLNLDGGADYVVVAAESPSPGAEGLPDVELLLRRKNVGSAWRFDHEHHEGVVALRFGFGIDDLVAVLDAAAAGRVGVSSPFARLERAVDGRRQARSACATASPGTTEVVRFGQRPLGVLLANSPEQARAMADAVLGPVLAMPDEDGAVMLETARAWLAAGGSTSTAARQLHVHRNTVRYRLRRLEEATGRDLAVPIDAAEVYVALECVRILGLAPG
jgi:hypothetical protein